jgi:hypothetical protein
MVCDTTVHMPIPKAAVLALHAPARTAEHLIGVSHTPPEPPNTHSAYIPWISDYSSGGVVL